MKCPYCGEDDNYVISRDNSKAALKRTYHKRYRRCRSCGKAFKTREVYKEDKK